LIQIVILTFLFFAKLYLPQVQEPQTNYY